MFSLEVSKATSIYSDAEIKRYIFINKSGTRAYILIHLQSLLVSTYLRAVVSCCILTG